MIAYHGCDVDAAERLLRGEPFKKSQNDYDWLGEGVYFWELGADRALGFAHDQKGRGRVTTPAIVGALIQLGRCFDLMDTRFTEELPTAFKMCKDALDRAGQPLPANAGKTPDKCLRRRDCAVLNYYLNQLERRQVFFDTVRCGFVEGPPAFQGSGIRHQIAAARCPGASRNRGSLRTHRADVVAILDRIVRRIACRLNRGRSGTGVARQKSLRKRVLSGVRPDVVRMADKPDKQAPEDC